jgi:Putative MetA-pathway of phenol degradation
MATEDEGMERARYLAAAAVAALLCSAGPAAQELQPRAYWPLPRDSNTLIIGYQRTQGDVLVDASLPVDGVEARADFLLVGYQRTFDLFGRTASVNLNQPFADSSTSGIVGGQFVRRDVNGLADFRARFAVNLKGAPSMDRAGFLAWLRNPQTIVGASVLVQAPTGQYDADRYINLGTNRWSVKPAIGLIAPLGSGWALESELGAWLFGANDDFLGRTRRQDPILSAELHAVRARRNGFWISIDANFYDGGQTEVGGVKSDDRLRNSRLGATILVPIGKGNALRGSISTGLVTSSGSDFDVLTLAYLRVW